MPINACPREPRLRSFWHKVGADLGAQKSRTLLAIVSMAIGVFVVGTLLGMIDLQLSQMDAAHQRSQPSHISLMLKTDAPLAVAAHLKTLADVADVDMQTQFTVHYKTRHDAQWQTGTAIFRPDYQQQRYDVLGLLAGTWPQGLALGIERLSAHHAGLSLGEQVEFETASGSTTLTLESLIRHPFVKPPPFGGQLHFFIAPSSVATFGIAPNTFRQLLVQVTAPYSEAKARMVASALRTELHSLGIGVNATLLQNPTQHWGRPFFSGINLVLTVMAWASLALSSVLILNTIAALITQQTDQIGIMKSFGARRLSIARIYLTEVLLVALLAVLLALPFSLFGAYYSSRWLLDLFNIELQDFAYSTRALVLMTVGGLLAPLIAAFYPIWRGAAMSVRSAMASYGLGGDFNPQGVTGWLERQLSLHLPTLYAVTLGNVFRRKARMFWTQSVLVIAGVLFISILSLIASVNLTLDNELARSRYSVRLGFSSDQPSALVTELARSLPQTTAVELWQRLPAELRFHENSINPSGSLGLQILALPETTTRYQPLIVAGRWFNAADQAQNVLVLNAATAERNGIQVGDSLQVSLFGRLPSNWQVIGLYRWFAGAGYVVEPVYAPLSSVQSITQRTQTSSFALLSADITTLPAEQAYTNALKQRFQERQIPLDVYTTSAKLEQRQYANNQFRPITRMLLGLAGLIAVVAAIGLSGMLAISVLQRTREIGVLRAIGASSPAIFKLFMLEGFFHGLIAWSISIPLAYALAEPLAKSLGEIMLGIQLDFSFSWTAVWLWLLLVSLLVISASYWPARRATRIAVRDSLNY